MKGYCPECDELVGIAPTEQPVGRTGTARRWRVDMHPDKREPDLEKR